MAYDFVAASSQYIEATSSPVTATPLTLAGWGKQVSTTTAQIFVSVSNSTSAHRCAIGFNSGQRTFASQFGNISPQIIVNNPTATNTISTSIFTHVAGVFTSTTDRTVYRNGTNTTNDTTNIGAQDAFNQLLLGARNSGAIGLYMDGNVAEVGIWNVALTAAEIASLAKGMTCNLVRPQSLVFYAPLIRNLQDVRRGLTLTNNNTATVANHPRVYR